MKKTIVLCLLVLSAMAFIAVLYWYTDPQRIRQYIFSRNVHHDITRLERIVLLPDEHYYISGVTNNHVYLSNSKRPLQISIITREAVSSTPVHGLPFNVRDAEIRIDSPFFYVYDLNRYTIFQGLLDSLMITDTITEGELFAEAVPINANALILRTIDRKKNLFMLEKKNRNKEFNLSVSGVLEKQVDGLFCTDGMLHYEPELNQVVYIYTYRNQFILMDTSLVVQHHGNTIDPIARAQLSVANVASEQAIFFSSPPLVVNRQSAVSANYLYVNSAIASEEEDLTVFGRNSVIDVYDLREGTYRFSFYIPDYDNLQMKRFTVTGNKLIALHGKYVLFYSLDVL